MTKAPSLVFFSLIVIFLLLPFNRLNLDIGFRLIPIYILMPVLLVSLIFIRQKSIFKVTPFEKVLLPFYIFTILSSFWTYQHDLSLRYLFGITLVCTTFIVLRVYLANHLSAVQRALNIGLKLFVLFSFLNYGIGLKSMSLLAEHVDFYGLTIEKSIPRMIGLNNDPNICAYTFLIISFYFLYSKESLAKLFFILSFTAIILTMSRGGLAAFFIGLVGSFLVRDKKNDVKLILFSVLSVMVLSAAVYINYELLEPFIDKRLRGLSAGGGRFHVWESAIKLIIEKPFIGYGIFSFREVMFENYNIAKFAHNTYIEVFFETGFIGGVMFIFGVTLFLILSFNLAKQSQAARFLFPASCACFFAMFGLSMYIHMIFWMLILLHSIFYLRETKFES